MKSILKKVAGVALVAVLALGMFNCSFGSDYSVKETVATPEFSVESSAVINGTEVTISCATEGAKIYYTIDGTEPTEKSKEYKAAIIVMPPMTLKAIAVKDGMNDSAVASANYTIKETVAIPVFGVAPGAVNSGTSVIISCATEGARIYYTTDGTEPTAKSTEYTAAISVTEAVTLKAIAVKTGMNNSVVASASYTIKGTVAIPVFSVESGAVNSGTSVIISCATEGARIYYTTDGTEPTASSTEYKAAISVTPPMTIKAIAVKDGMNDSAVASASYTIKGTVVTPEFSVESSAVNTGTSVTITCVTEGAKIYYTTDGTEPTAKSTEYKAAISVTPPMTIKAIAVKDGMNDSTVASVSYTISSFVKVKGTTITGTEEWTPTSNVFVSRRGITIPDMYVCDHEVTRGEFKELMGTDPSTASAYDKDGKMLTEDAVLNNPVTGVSWYAAIAYCNKLSLKENLTPCYSVSGVTDWENLAYSSIPSSRISTWDALTYDKEANGYRLPTEAEWEWLARGGENYTYAGSNTVNDVAWSDTNNTGTREVKTKKANGYGLYDMSGNVFEWCYDWGNDNSVSSSTADTGVSSGTDRVFRGGSWYTKNNFCAVSSRRHNYPFNCNSILGFRVVRNAN